MRTIEIPRRYAYGSMRGNGIGGIFSRLIKPLIKSAIRIGKPIAKESLKKIGKIGLETASNVVSDMATGVRPKQALKQNLSRGVISAKREVKKGGKKTLSSLKKHIKGGKQYGTGKRKRSGARSRSRKTRKKNQLFLKNIFKR